MSGFSLVEVMVAITVMIVGLMAVTAATTTSAMMRKRATEEQTIFTAMQSQLESIQADLFTVSDLQTQIDNQEGALAGGQPFTLSFNVDTNGDGNQDMLFAKDDKETPIVGVTITAPTGQPSVLLRVDVAANWYGVGGDRNMTMSTLVGNRRGYGG